MGSMGSGTFLEVRAAVYLLCGGRANTMVEDNSGPLRNSPSLAL